jgi:para-nitrobenzyl esterase
VGGAVGSEDCLYLNVWRPASAERGLPVYVYVHGGGNSTGAADALPDYMGYAVAARSGMVFVSLNYRLGPLGWFLDPDIAEGADPDSASGNFGTLDIIQALKWVHDNVEAFGGDPSRVTLAGESAGALNTLSLMLSSKASGLFQRAVVESGYRGFSSPETAREASRKLFASLLVKRGKAPDEGAALKLADLMPSADRAALLRAASARELVSLLKGGTTGMSGWPSAIADGLVLPSEGFAAFSGAYANRVPLIIGSNKEETKLFLYFAGKPDWRKPLYRAMGKFGGLSWKAAGVDSIADAIASSPNAPGVYVYRFDWGSPWADGKSVLPGAWGRRVGAFHASEVGFFLGTDSCLGALFTGRLHGAANEKGRRALSSGIMAYLAAFAASGDPNAIAAGGELRREPLPRWAPRPEDAARSAAAGEPVGIVFDANLAEASFAPLAEVVTKEGVDAAIDAELGPLEARAVRAGLMVK